MNSGQPSGSRRAAGTPPSDERDRAEARQRVESPEGEEPTVAPAAAATAAAVGAPQPADRPVAPIAAAEGGEVEPPAIVEPTRLNFDWGDNVESDDDADRDDLTVEIDPPEEAETDAAEEREDTPREAEAAAESAAQAAADAAQAEALAGIDNPKPKDTRKARDAAKAAAKKARAAAYNRRLFVRLGDALAEIGTGENNTPVEILKVVADLYDVCSAFHPDVRANAADRDRVSPETIADVVAHFARVYDLTTNTAEAERRVDVAKKIVESILHTIVNDEMNVERGWTRPARGGGVDDIDLLEFPRLYDVFVTGLGVSIYEGQLPPAQRDPNIASTPTVRRFLSDIIVMFLDEMNNGVPVPDAIASAVTSAGEDRHPLVLNDDKSFIYNPVQPSAIIRRDATAGTKRSGTLEFPNVCKLAPGLGPGAGMVGARGRSERTTRLGGFRDEDDFVARTGSGEVVGYLQEDEDGRPGKKASIVLPVTHHGVVGVDRTLIPANMEDKFKKHTGRAWRFMRAACLATPITVLIVVLRLLPTRLGGVDEGIIGRSSVVVNDPTATSGYFFPPFAEPSNRDVLQTGAILHDLSTTNHAAIRAASRMDNGEGSVFPFPLLRSFDDMGGLARRCVLAVVLLVMRNVMLHLLKSPEKASLAWRVQALMRHEYVTLAFLVINTVSDDHWMIHYRQLRALLVALCVLPVVGSHIRNMLKAKREKGDITARRRVLELGTHLLRTMQLFDPSCSWRIPAATFAVYDNTITLLANLYVREFGLRGVGPSRFPNAVNLAPQRAGIPAANHGVRRAIDFDPPEGWTRVVLSIRVSDPRSLVDVDQRGKASVQQLYTAAMALRDTHASVGVRARVGEFVVHVATGSKRRHDEVYWVAFAPHPDGHLHQALQNLISGEDVDAARQSVQARAAADEAAEQLAAAELVLQNLSGDATRDARTAAGRNAVDARGACERATTDFTRAAAQLRYAGNQYGVRWSFVHAETFAGVTVPIIDSASPSDPNNASSTFVYGRGYADFLPKVDHLLEKRSSAGVVSRSVVVLFAVAWLDRIPPRAMKALRANSRLPVAAFSATETAAVLRRDPRSFLCPVTGGARLADVEIEPDGSAARYRVEQSPCTLAMRDFLESFASAASFGTMEWATFPYASMAVDGLGEKGKSVFASFIREIDAHVQGDGREDAAARDNAAARFAVALDPDPDVAAGVAAAGFRDARLPRRLIAITRRSGTNEKFAWQFKKLAGFITAAATMMNIVYNCATTFALNCVSGVVPVDEIRGGVRVRHHPARRGGERPQPVQLFDGSNMEDIDDLGFRDAHEEWNVDAFEGAWIRRAIDDVNRRDAERAARERRAAPPPADVVFVTVSRVCNPGTIKELARYVRRTGGRVFDCTIFRALVFDDVEGVDDERARLRAFLLNRDGSLKLDDPRVEGVLTFLSLQSVSWRFGRGVILPYWRER